jgi:nitrogen fixation protein FixH
MNEGREFTGKHALAVFGGAFGIIIAVNLILAWSAVATFPGLEVKNSYVASQSFDARRTAQQALGWTAEAALRDGRLVVSLRDADGQPVQAAQVTALVGRPTHTGDDVAPALAFDGRDYVGRAELATGAWMVRLTAQALDGTAFEQRLDLWVRS